MRLRSAIPRGAVAHVREVGRTLRDPVLALWAIYILLNPIYVFPSGMPQPGDFLIIALVPAILATGPIRFTRDGMRALRPLLLFMAYVFASALVWTLVAGEFSFQIKSSFLVSPFFYLYNIVFFVITLVLFSRYRERFLWLTVQLTLASVVVQVLVSFVFSRGVSRGAVLFNSSNQLGYFALLSASIIVLGHKRLRLGTIPTVVGLIGCAYLALFSASKAALGGIAILAVVGLIANPKMVVTAGLAVLVLLSFDNPITKAYDKSRARMEKDEAYGMVQERGYDRILLHKEYWMLGAGEGVYRRFKHDQAVIGKHEIHSSGGTLFFCYGFAGCIFFLAFIFRVIEGARLGLIIQLLPVAGYSATHQSLRFTMLWVLFALFVVMKRRPEAEAEAAAAAPRVPSLSPARSLSGLPTSKPARSWR